METYYKHPAEDFVKNLIETIGKLMNTLIKKAWATQNENYGYTSTVLHDRCIGDIKLLTTPEV